MYKIKIEGGFLFIEPKYSAGEHIIKLSSIHSISLYKDSYYYKHEGGSRPRTDIVLRINGVEYNLGEDRDYPNDFINSLLVEIKSKILYDN